MGTCFGHCFKTTRKYNRCRTLYFCKNDFVEFDCLVEKGEPTMKGFTLVRSFSSFLSHKKKKALPKSIAIELIEDSWPTNFMDESVVHDVSSHLPCHHIEYLKRAGDLNGEFFPLDARDLLVSCPHGSFGVTQEHVTLHSTPPSSIDLEWEHEESLDAGDGSCLLPHTTQGYSRNDQHSSVNHLQRIPSSNRQSITTNDSSSASKDNSRMTTPESLEWDFVDTSVLPGIDRETELLIAEIENLAARALQETGDHLLNSTENTNVDGIS